MKTFQEFSLRLAGLDCTLKFNKKFGKPTNLCHALPKERNPQQLRVQATGIQQLRCHRFSFSLAFVQEIRDSLDCIRIYLPCTTTPTRIVQESGGTNLLPSKREGRTVEYWLEVVAVQNGPRVDIPQYGSTKLG